MVDLSRPDEKPAANPEGYLRALRSSAPASGIEWESRARLGVTAANYVTAVPRVNCPEAGIDNTTTAAAVAFTCVEIQAGQRGCYAYARFITTSPFLQRFDSPEVVPAATIAVIPFLWQINGGVQSVVRVCDSPITGGWPYGIQTLTQFLALDWETAYFWIAPGAVVRFCAGLAATPLTACVIVREPLAA